MKTSSLLRVAVLLALGAGTVLQGCASATSKTVVPDTQAPVSAVVFNQATQLAQRTDPTAVAVALNGVTKSPKTDLQWSIRFVGVTSYVDVGVSTAGPTVIDRGPSAAPDK